MLNILRYFQAQLMLAIILIGVDLSKIGLKRTLKVPLNFAISNLIMQLGDLADDKQIPNSTTCPKQTHGR